MKRVILITGASEGIGKCLAKKMVSRDENTVVLLAQNEEILRKTSVELGCPYLVCDISDYKQVQKAADFMQESYGRIDILVNNAGVIFEGELDKTPYEVIESVVKINTLGAIYFCKAVIPIMKKQRGGKILNVVSIAGLAAGPRKTVYNASKWALTGFTDGLRQELVDYNISVMAVFPGLVDTNLFRNAGLTHDMKNALSPESVAGTIDYMLSFENVNFDKVVLRNLHR